RGPLSPVARRKVLSARVHALSHRGRRRTNDNAVTDEDESPMIHRFLCVLMLLFAFSSAALADEFDDVARDFWAWRANEQPFSTDDMPRIDRPAGWKADWSPAAVAQRRKDLVMFEARWEKMKPAMSTQPIPRQVDFRLIGSAIARVRWELEVTRGWQRN